MLSIFFITIARDAHYKNKQDKDMKRLILLIIIISISFVACSTGTKSPLKMQNANVGEKVYKEVSVNGETISKWLTVSEISEYDNKGNKIHYKTPAMVLKTGLNMNTTVMAIKFNTRKLPAIKSSGNMISKEIIFIIKLPPAMKNG